MNKILTLTITAGFLSICVFTGCGSGEEKKAAAQDSTQVMDPQVPQKITFPSLDNLPVTANLYLTDKNKPFIVLCHMAGFNKSEYRDIAKKLMERGFNCLAIDQRSGGETSGYENETNREALMRGLGTSYLDAEQDMVAAVNYIAENYFRPVILWGSSYSASLALKIGKASDNVKAVIAFSPGEYFISDSLILKDHIRDIGKPVFITSSRDEVNNDLMKIIDAAGPKTVTHFRPKGKGEHGSMALWDDAPDHFEYWKAVDEFLEKLK